MSWSSTGRQQRVRLAGRPVPAGSARAPAAVGQAGHRWGAGAWPLSWPARSTATATTASTGLGRARHGLLDADGVEQLVEAALQSGLRCGEREARRTIASALRRRVWTLGCVSSTARRA